MSDITYISIIYIVFQSKIGLSLLLQTSGARHEPAMIIELIAEFDMFEKCVKIPKGGNQNL
jgi:hypothetical protein